MLAIIYIGLYSVTIAVGLYAIYIGIPFLYARMLKRNLVNSPMLQNKLVITLDDGPGKLLTLDILELLNKHNVKVSFFLLGRNIIGNEHIVREIADANHDIFSHGFDHLHYWKITPLRAIIDIKKGFDSINTALGKQNTKYAFRPPFGKLNLFVLLYLWFYKIPIHYWTDDSEDTLLPINIKNSDKIAKHVKQEGGGIVLLAHDFDRHDTRINTFVLEMLENLILTAKENNIEIVPMSQLDAD